MRARAPRTHLSWFCPVEKEKPLIEIDCAFAGAICACDNQAWGHGSPRVFQTYMKQQNHFYTIFLSPACICTDVNQLLLVHLIISSWDRSQQMVLLGRGEDSCCRSWRQGNTGLLLIVATECSARLLYVKDGCGGNGEPALLPLIHRFGWGANVRGLNLQPDIQWTLTFNENELFHVFLISNLILFLSLHGTRIL